MRNSVIDIMIVDDSTVFRKFLINSLEGAPDIRVVGTASNGVEAVGLLRNLKPDVVLMDINMPGMDGFDTTAEIMSTSPTPVIIISGEYSTHQIAKTFRALEVGAVDILPKPTGINHPNHDAEILKIITRIRLMSEIKVVRRTSNSRSSSLAAATHGPIEFSLQTKSRLPVEISVVGIGASAGGPMILQTILEGLPTGFDIPIVIVQHIEPSFAEGFAEWLGMTTNRKVCIATDGMRLEKGMIVLPPGDMHLGFRDYNVLEVTHGLPEQSLRPSINHLLLSMAAVYASSAIGIILSGMGSDGTIGLQRMRERGAVTIAQDAATSLIHGMPGSAIRANAATHIYTPEQIVNYLKHINNHE